MVSRDGEDRIKQYSEKDEEPTPTQPERSQYSHGATSHLQQLSPEDYLMEINRAKFKKIFAQIQTTNKTDQIEAQDLYKFCKTVKIVPDLISISELKKLVGAKAPKPGIMNFEMFENCIREIAYACL